MTNKKTKTKTKRKYAPEKDRSLPNTVRYYKNGLLEQFGEFDLEE